MTTYIELITPTDTIGLYPTPDITGFVYDNETLDAWYAQAEADPDAEKRPNAHGTYSPGEIYLNAHSPIVTGQYYGVDQVDALNQRNRLAGLFNDGKPIAIRVVDELGPTTREAWLITREAPFRNDFTHFTFDMVFFSPDPRRYSPAVVATDGMPSAGGGLYWDLGTAPSGLYLDWGAEGVLGQVTFTNTGQSATSPRIEVGGPGAFDSGFRITEIETGRELIFARATNDGDVIVFDSRTQRATINSGGDVTGAMTSRDWFDIPAGATRRYQINPLGGVTGAPTITLYAAPANL